MKRYLTILFLFVGIALHATNYYVKTGGSDAAAGTSDGTAWATITKVNTVWAAGTFAAGDSILFRRGDVFYGSITAGESGTSGSHISIGAYGTGAKPVLTGFTTVSSWTSYGGGIYYATVTAESTVEMVTIGGVQYAMGRTPNEGSYYRVDELLSSTGGTPYEFRDVELGATPDWTGAEVAVRKNNWIIDKCPVTDYREDTVRITHGDSFYPFVEVNSGYIFQKSLLTLDVFGEWYHDHSANRLYMYFGGETPSSYTVKASTLNRGVYTNRFHYLTFRNVRFEGYNTETIYLYETGTSVTYQHIMDCDIMFSGGLGVRAYYPFHVEITGCTFDYTNDMAIRFDLTTHDGHNLISGNAISNTGTVFGAGSSGGGKAIYRTGRYSIVEDNVITNTGYIPIEYSGEGTIIRNNYVDNFCYVKDDGGAIYIYNDRETGREVYDNIILNSTGAGTTNSNQESTSAHGLYTDGRSHNVTFTNNIVGNVVGAAYHGNLPQNVTLRENTFFECSEFLDLWKYDGSYSINSMNIKKNVFVTSKIKDDLPAMIFYQNSTSSIYGSDPELEIEYFGAIDSNYYFVNQETGIYTLWSSGSYTESAPKSVARWTAEYGYDAHSVVQVMDTYTLNSLGSNLLTNGTFNSNITGWTTNTGASAVWNNGELGDGGCIALTSTIGEYQFYWWSNGNTVSTSISGGTISSSNHYILRFLGKSAIDEKTMALKLYSTGTNLNKQRFFTVGNTNTQKDVLFSYPANVTSGATMRLSLADDPVTTYMDNIGLYVADVTLTDWDNYLHLLYNETSETKYYDLSATMEDVTGTEYSGTVAIGSWQGLILIGNGTVSDHVEGTTGALLKSKDGVRLLKSKNDVLLKLEL